MCFPHVPQIVMQLKPGRKADVLDLGLVRRSRGAWQRSPINQSANQQGNRGRMICAHSFKTLSIREKNVVGELQEQFYVARYPSLGATEL
jgi:hypothetical protein